MYEPGGKHRHIQAQNACMQTPLYGYAWPYTVDKSQNRNNSRPETVDNSVDGVDRYASIHPFEGGMNMQKMDQAAKAQLAACFAGETT